MEINCLKDDFVLLYMYQFLLNHSLIKFEPDSGF